MQNKLPGDKLPGGAERSWTIKMILNKNFVKKSIINIVLAVVLVIAVLFVFGGEMRSFFQRYSQSR